LCICRPSKDDEDGDGDKDSEGIEVNVKTLVRRVLGSSEEKMEGDVTLPNGVISNEDNLVASDLLSNLALEEDNSAHPLVYYTGSILVDKLKVLKKTYEEINNELGTISTSHNGGSMLAPLEGDHSGGGWTGGTVIIAPGQTMDLAVVFHPSQAPLKGEVLLDETTLTRHIQIRLLSFSYTTTQEDEKEMKEMDLAPTEGTEWLSLERRLSMKKKTESVLSLLKPRSLYLRAKATRSEMVLMQRNINFGKIVIGESASGVMHGVTIVNKSALLPLAYSISKSGSYASGALRIPSGRKGLIAPSSSQTVAFVFKPTLTGSD
jgi:hypothetical protein